MVIFLPITFVRLHLWVKVLLGAGCWRAGPGPGTSPPLQSHQTHCQTLKKWVLHNKGPFKLVVKMRSSTLTCNLQLSYPHFHTLLGKRCVYIQGNLQSVVLSHQSWTPAGCNQWLCVHVPNFNFILYMESSDPVYDVLLHALRIYLD